MCGAEKKKNFDERNCASKQNEGIMRRGAAALAIASPASHLASRLVSLALAGGFAELSSAEQCSAESEDNASADIPDLARRLVE